MLYHDKWVLELTARNIKTEVNDDMVIEQLKLLYAYAYAKGESNKLKAQNDLKGES